MQTAASVVAVLGALLIGAISPGPSFVLVARTALARSRPEGLAAAAGMGMGGVLFAALVLLGLQAALTAVPWLYLALKMVGGGYLVYLGIRIFRAAREPLTVPERTADHGGKLAGAFWLALTTQLSNPKTALVYGSLFAALLPRELPLGVALALPPLVFLVEAGWYAVVALALSADSPRGAYLRSKTSIDRLAGAVLAALGLRLVATAPTVS